MLRIFPTYRSVWERFSMSSYHQDIAPPCHRTTKSSYQQVILKRGVRKVITSASHYPPCNPKHKNPVLSMSLYRQVIWKQRIVQFLLLMLMLLFSLLLLLLFEFSIQEMESVIYIDPAVRALAHTTTNNNKNNSSSSSGSDHNSTNNSLLCLCILSPVLFVVLLHLSWAWHNNCWNNQHFFMN